MTLWLSNLAAFSVQLAVLVGTAAAVVAILRIDAPRPTLRFWQVLFATGLLWPLGQLWWNAGGSGLAATSRLAGALPGDVLWNGAAAGVRGMRAGIAALDATLTLLIVGAIAAGAVCRIGWIGLGLIRLRSIRATAEPAPALAALAAALQRELGVTADIRLSDAVGSPATTGARRPIVLVPPRMIDLPPEVQRAVLCHELLHVRRRDWLPALIEEVWCALLWFHPSARALASRLGLARETLVDELAIAHTGDRRGYARALLEFSTDRPRLAGAAALIGRRHLEQRIALIAQEVPMPRASLVIRLAAAAVAVAVVTMAASSSVPLSATVQERIYKPSVDKGITVPKVIHEVKPTYTPEAMQARIQGSVFMTVVVLPSGDVGDVTVTESLDQEHGLDQQAVDATKQWKFEPGTLDGQAVAVEVVIQMTFTLKS